jgi:hypothetical protein
VPVELSAAELRNPRLEKSVIEEAVAEYLQALREPYWAPIRWFDDATSAYDYIYKGSVRWSAVRAESAHRFISSAATAAILDSVWQAVRAAARSKLPRHGYPETFQDQIFGPVPLRLVELLQRMAALDEGAEPPSREPMDAPLAGVESSIRERTRISVENALVPMADAFAAGLFLFWVTANEVVCIARPAVWVADGRVHREDGPAIEWPTGESYWLWRGAPVPPWLIEQPQRITAALIRGEFNQEVRRCMLERFGVERYIRESGARLLSEDDCGKLWRVDLGDASPHTMVEVENGTVEPDGTRRRYFLRVPSKIRSSREAVAWTYGLTMAQYEVAVRT